MIFSKKERTFSKVFTHTNFESPGWKTIYSNVWGEQKNIQKNAYFFKTF